MPIYEYECTKCGKTFEKVQKHHEATESIECPYCGEKDCKRLPSSFYSRENKESGFSCRQQKRFS